MAKKIHQFLDELEIRRRSPNTVSACKRDLKLYSEFLKQSAKNRQDISLFYEYIDKKNLSARSKARTISTVRTYFRFLESKGQKTQLKKLSPVPVQKTLPKLISPEEFYKIYQASIEKNKHKSFRNHIALLLLFGLGCRITELIQINLQHISEMDHSLIVTGKRNKQRVLPLTQDLFTRLKEYIAKTRPFLLKNSNTYSLIINNRGKRPSRVDVYRWLSLWSQKAGFREVKSPHQFRHGFATNLLENGADLRSIQFLLGHAGIETTQIYTSVKKGKLKTTIQNCHPLSALKSQSG